MAVVQYPTELHCNKLVPQCANVAVKSQSLDIHVRNSQNRCARGLVTPPRLDSDEPILDDIDTTDTMFPAQSIKGKEDINGIRDRLVLFSEERDLDGLSRFEFDMDLLGGSGCSFDSRGEFPHVSGGSNIRIFEDACLVRDMEEVLVR